MKKANKKILAVTVTAVSALGAACSHSNRDLTARLYKNKWDYKTLHRGLASGDDAKYFEKQMTIGVYGVEGMPPKALIYKGDPKLHMQVSIAKKMGLVCETDTKNKGEELGDAVVFDIKDEQSVFCSFAGYGRNISEKAEVTYRLSKVNLSFAEVNDNLRGKLEDAKKQIEEKKFDVAAPAVIAATPMFTKTLDVTVKAPKGTSFDIEPEDYVEFSAAEGKFATNQKDFEKKPYGPEGLGGRPPEERNKITKAQRAQFIFKEAEPYSLVCSFMDAPPKGAKKDVPRARTIVYSPAESGRAVLSGKRGKVTCQFNGLAYANYWGYVGGFKLKVSHLKPAEVLKEINGLIDSQENARVKANELRDKANLELMNKILVKNSDDPKQDTSVARVDELNSIRFEAVKPLNDARVARIEELEAPEHERIERARKAEEAEKEKKEAEYAEMMDKDFPSVLQQNAYKVAVVFSAEPMKFPTSMAGRRSVDLTDVKISKTYVVYRTPDGKQTSRYEDLFDQARMIPSPQDFSDSFAPAKFHYCYDQLDEVRNEIESLRDAKKDNQYNEIMARLAKKAVKPNELQKCFSKMSDKAGDFEIITMERAKKYRFCWKMGKEMRQVHGRQLPYVVMEPSRIFTDYRTQGGLMESNARQTAWPDKSEHPFFKKKFPINHPYEFRDEKNQVHNYRAENNEKCKDAKYWSPELVVTAEDVIDMF